MKSQLASQEANLLKFDQQRFVTGELEADSYSRLKRHTQDQIEKLKRDMEDLRLTDTAFEKYSRYGISLLTHMDIYFRMASLEVKRKMLGSIFPGKLIYQDGKYRTEGMNPALSLILQKTNGLQSETTGNAFITENVSGDVPFTDLTSNHFIDGMRKMYELQPLINLDLNELESTREANSCFFAVSYL